MAPSKENTFHIGICMAGAISAGAYTAGVMDYLLEALEHWQKAKELNLPGVPQHNIQIEVMGGTSAGGMTAAITAAAMQRNFKHVTADDVKMHTSHNQHNPIYNAWVNLTELSEGKDMMSQMLDTNDVKNDKVGNQNKEVRAGFNSSFIKKIADNVLDERLEKIANRPYLAPKMDVFTTVTNLRGFNYQIKFKTSTGEQSFSMKMHRDYAFFRIGDEAYDNDGRIPISFKKANASNISGQNINILKQAAMSTGAFPVGLESRTLKREKLYIQDSKYLNLRIAGEDDPRVKYTFLPDDEKNDFESLNVDGGVINNEPFEVTQQLIDDRRKTAIVLERMQANGLLTDEQNLTQEQKEAIKNIKDEVDKYQPETSAAKFDSTVIMIDPFPSEPEGTEEFAVKQAWKQVLPSVLSAMLGQLRLKEAQIKRAYLSDDYTRFLVAPSRTLKGKEQEYSIACGSLGGFGGFFSKKFREHDFLLGRRNCQQFLQKHFSAPKATNGPPEKIKGNFILEYGYKDKTTMAYTYTAKKTITVGEEKMDYDVTYLPIIPDLRVSLDEKSVYQPPTEAEPLYPSLDPQYLLGLRKKIKKRISCLAHNIDNPVKKKSKKNKKTAAELIRGYSLLTAIKKTVGKAGFLLYAGIGLHFGKGALANMFIDSVINDMYQRGLIDKKEND